MDPHFLAGSAPGDGQALALQALMGTKRAAYRIYGGKSIPARTALELGIISDVLAREQLLPRAWELAEIAAAHQAFSRGGILGKHVVAVSA
jgi:enoyl-CoA hydratase/carnithine racemase